MESDDKVQARLNAIQELIKTHPIEDQLMLAQLLSKHYGIDVNQSIISKDLRRLGISKHKVGTTMMYELPTTDATREILRRAIINIAHNESLVVITTKPGLADFVGDYVDAHEHIGMLGCIAGENVVFVTPKTTQHIKQLYKKLCELLHVKQ